MEQFEPDAIERLASLFGPGPVVVLTGAGISTDSGIPDYRGKGSPPRTPMNIAQFMDDEAYRRRFWAGARVGADRYTAVHPNAGHRTLAQLEEAGFVSGVITQNVDGLHREAGTKELVEVHGNGGVIRCVSCGTERTRKEVLARFDALNLGFADRNRDAPIAPDGDAVVSDIDDVRVPNCPVCAGTLRPSVVYFGELVPRDVFTAGAQLVDRSSALIVAGSSLAVNTGVRFVRQAERLGLPVAVINRGPTKIDGNATIRLEAGTSETFSALADQLTRNERTYSSPR